MGGPSFSRDVEVQQPTGVKAWEGASQEVPAELIPARARRWVYALYALGSVALGATQVGYSAGGFEHPTWLTIATAVWVFLGGSQGLLALLKTPPTG